MAKTKRSTVKALTAGKISIPMSDYDPSKDQSYAGDSPKRGVYTFKLTEVRHHESSAGNSSIYWRFRIEDPTSPYHGWPYGDQYTNLDSTLWKTQQIMYALTGDTKDVDLDLSDTKAGEKSRQKLVDGARLVRGSVVIEAGNDEYEDRPRLNKVMLLDEFTAKRLEKATAEADEDEFDEDEEDDFDDADEFDDEDEDLDDEDDDDEDEEDDDEDDEEEDEDEDEDEEDEPEPEPVKPAKRVRRSVKEAAPAAAAPAKSAATKRAAAGKRRK